MDDLVRVAAADPPDTADTVREPMPHASGRIQGGRGGEGFDSPRSTKSTNVRDSLNGGFKSR